MKKGLFCSQEKGKDLQGLQSISFQAFKYSSIQVFKYSSIQVFRNRIQIVLVVFEETEELQIHYINFIVANSKD